MSAVRFVKTHNFGAVLKVLALALAIVLPVGFLSDQGLLGVLLLPVLVGLAVMLYRPLWGLLLIAASIPLESILVLGEGMTVTWTRVLGVAVFAAWLAGKVLRGESWKSIFGSYFSWVAVGFIALVLASALWAVEPARSFTGFVTLAQLFLLALLIMDLVSSWERVDLVAKAILLGAMVAAVLTLQQFFVHGVRRAGSDIAGGINGTAVVLLTLIPFAFYLLRSQRSRFWRIFGVLYVVAAIMAITVTFSRMNFLLLPPLLAAQFWHTFWGRRGRGWVFTLAAAVVGAAYFVPWDVVRARASTIGPYMSSAFLDESTLYTDETGDRGYHLIVGLAIARDHPLIGVGYNNYGVHFIRRYQYEVPRAPKLYHKPRSPHSSHVGILADLGIAGFTMWFMLMGVAVRSVLTAWRRTRRVRLDAPYFFVQALAYGLGLHLVPYGFYLPNQDEKILWVLLGLSVAAHQLTKKTRSTRSLSTVNAAHDLAS